MYACDAMQATSNTSRSGVITFRNGSGTAAFASGTVKYCFIHGIPPN